MPRKTGRHPTGVAETKVEITPLTQEQCLSMLNLRLGVSADAFPDQAADLWHSAQGNPYFLDQLMEGFDPESSQFQVVPLDDIVIFCSVLPSIVLGPT